MKLTKIALVATTAIIAAGNAFADGHCAVDGTGINILSAAFPAVNAVQDEAALCGATSERDQEFTAKINPALEANPSPFNAVIGANSSFSTANAAGLVSPITDIPGVSDVSPSMQIKQDGEVVAIAFMANAEHLMVRDDLLELAGMEMPTSWEGVIELVDAVEAAGGIEGMEYPLTGVFSGWSMGEQFVNMWQATGQPMFVNGTEANINNEHGVAVLNMLAELTSRMNPDYQTFNTNAVQAQFEQGTAGIANLWGSRGQNIINGVEALGQTVTFGAGPTMGGGSMPASTLWWDGFFFASNQSDEDRARAVALAIDSADAEMLAKGDNVTAAVWLIDGYEPTPAAAGVIATAEAGANPYPMLPNMGAMHTALQNEIIEFLNGEESAEQALADVVDAYNTALAE